MPPKAQPEPARSARRRRRPPAGRLVALLLIVAVATLALLGIALWWEERPLRAVERALGQGQYDVALDLANAYLARVPRSSRALDLKGRALVGMSRFDEAAMLFGAVGTDSIAGQRAWSIALLRAGRWSEALPLLKRLVAETPEDPDLLHETASCHMRIGEFDDAVAMAERLTRVSGQEERGFLLLGVLHNNYGNFRLAAEAWQKVLATNADATGLQIGPDEFFLGLGQALVSDGRAQDGLPFLKKSLALRPTANVHAILGDALEVTGEPAQAVEHWKKAVALDAGNSRAREGLARAALERRNPEEALRWLEPLIEGDQVTSAVAHSVRRALLLAGKPDEARPWEAQEATLRNREARKRAMDDILRQDPKSFWSTAVRAHRFASDGNRYQAAALLRSIEADRQKFPDPEGFLEQLFRAVFDQEPLPPLEKFPLKRH